MAAQSDVPALLRRLRGRSRVAQAQAAARLRQLADSAERCEDIAAAGGIPPLLDLLGDGSSTTALQEHAAATLHAVAYGGNNRCPDIVAAGGVAVLVRCLGFSQPELQIVAAKALTLLAGGSSETCDAISAAGGVAALVQLLQQGGIVSLRVAATAALIELGGHGSQDIRDEIVACGAVPPLVSALQASPPNPAGQQAQLCTAAAGVLNVLVSAEDTGGTAEEEAACAQRRASIAEAGGMQALLRMVQRSRDKNAVVLALNALWQLTADSPQRAEALAAAGGIPALVRCLSSRGGSSEALQDAATSALVSATADSPERQEAAVNAGALQALLETLRCGPALPQRQVLNALLFFAGVPGQTRAMLDAGAVPNLVLVAQLGDEKSAGSAANLLWLIADECSPDGCAAIAAAGGVPVLEQLLHRSQSSDVQAAAARALRALPMLPLAGQHPPRVCAAPDCTNSRRLNRCGGCGAVRYCSEACRDANWREHRPDCRRLRTEQAAAAVPEG